jgi:hypothetical protein
LGERDDGHTPPSSSTSVYMLYEELELMGESIEEALAAILVGR